jgi:rhomboid protease GluP
MPVSSDRPSTSSIEGGELPATRLDIAGQALLADPALGWRAELSRPGWLGLRSERGRVAFLAVDAEQPWQVLVELDHILQGAYPARYIVVLGGDAALRARLEALASDPAGPRIWLHHADGGLAWQNRVPRWQERRIARSLVDSAARAFERERWTAGEARAHARRLELDGVLLRSEARDFERFRLRLSQRKPRATVALAFVILAVFGLQALWGGTDLPPLLARMGSLVPGRVRDGEWWRLFSCTFLHGGVLHVGLNLLVLWMLGRSLERFIGPTRFLLIYFSAGLAGSLSSSLFVSSQSVGASGAIWGLLGAEAALAFYPRPLLPPSLIGVARRTAAANLGLNLVNSFNPHVDMAAHVGGGLMGAAVLVLLAASGRLSSHGRAAPPVGWLLRAPAALLVCCFLSGLCGAIVAGRPWRVDDAPELERVMLPGSPWSVEVPSERSARRESDEADATEFGNLAYDPSVVDIGWAPLSNGASARETREELGFIVHQLETVPAGLEQIVSPRVVRDEAHPTRSLVIARYRYSANPEVIDDRAIGIIDGVRVRVDVIAWAALPRAFEGLAARILRSFEASVAFEPRRRAGSVFHSGFPSPPRVALSSWVGPWHCLGDGCGVPFLDR